MMLAEHAPLSQIALLGTDISEPALARAARAIYAADEVAVVPAAMRAKWMMRGRADAGAQVRISPELRAVAELKKVNLMDVLEVHDTFDLVLLRNVLIYFDRPTQDGVVARVAERVRPGGLFCVGTSEALHAPLAGFEPLGLGVHRRGLS
jgi:chemotaxis protein methyltransferase CheR